jgi:ABC-type branched-subunit amino acid transport system substrate-binding protein
VVVPAVSPGASPAAKPASAVVVPAQPTVAPPSQLIGPIKIVSSLPRTGANKPQTDAIVNGIKMALDEAGNKIDGASVVYEDWDDASPSRGFWDAERRTRTPTRRSPILT